MARKSVTFKLQPIFSSKLALQVNGVTNQAHFEFLVMCTMALRYVSSGCL